MIYLAVVVGVVLISLLLAPFFVGPGGLLAAGSSVVEPDKLEAMKKALLKRYLEDEAAHKSGTLSNLAWDKRKEFLVHRYVDTSRRLDYLRNAVKLLAIGFAGFLAVAPGRAAAEVRVSPKHLVILRPGLDSVWGSYVFAVENDGQELATFKGKVMLPKETIDFAPQEGVNADQLTLAPGGGVSVDAQFPNGVHIVSVGFKVDGSFGKSNLTFEPATEVASLAVLTPRGGMLKVQAPGLAPIGKEDDPDPQYESFSVDHALPPGQSYVMQVEGLPEGRTRLWIVGGSVAGFLVVLTGMMAVRTRPKITGDASEAYLVG